MIQFSGRIAAGSVVLIMVLLACEAGGRGKQDLPASSKLTIATAANMQFAMDSIVAVFSRNTGTDCQVILGSSGKLTAQILEGAPYDVFISANMNYPKLVHERGLAPFPPKVYAYGRLVMWSLIDGYEPDMDDLVQPHIKHIAIANPELAPYGIAAARALEYYGLDEAVSGKLVYGESIAQTNQFIVSRSAEVGFTALSVVLSPQMEGRGQWTEISRESYDPIAQGIVLIRKNGIVKNEALNFHNFLLSGEAQKILSNFGYHGLGSPDIDL